jgi:hypothetical protein
MYNQWCSKSCGSAPSCSATCSQSSQTVECDDDDPGTPDTPDDTCTAKHICSADECKAKWGTYCNGKCTESCIESGGNITSCTTESYTCPDGTTTVERDPNNNCEFKPCPPCPEGTTLENGTCKEKPKLYTLTVLGGFKNNPGDTPNTDGFIYTWKAGDTAYLPAPRWPVGATFSHRTQSGPWTLSSTTTSRVYFTFGEGNTSITAYHKRSGTIYRVLLEWWRGIDNPYCNSYPFYNDNWPTKYWRQYVRTNKEVNDKDSCKKGCTLWICSWKARDQKVFSRYFTVTEGDTCRIGAKVSDFWGSNVGDEGHVTICARNNECGNYWHRNAQGICA